MAKEIKLTSDEIDTLTRILDEEISNNKVKIKWIKDKETRNDIRGALRIVERLNKKLVRMYRQQNKGGE